MCCTIAIGSPKSDGRPCRTVASADKPPADAAATTTLNRSDPLTGSRAPGPSPAYLRIGGPCSSHVARAAPGDAREPTGSWLKTLRRAHDVCKPYEPMAQHDVVVIGASSGGVEALLKVLSGLPAELAAAVFVVLHVRPDAPSYLPAILNRAGNLPAAHAVDGESIRQGRIYVAPPGHQTYVQKGRIGVRRGPSGNLHRPAIDPLFRTAAHHYGPRCIGIVLSGALDDGSAGLLAIERGGGVTIVQDPTDAAGPHKPPQPVGEGG